MTSDVHRLTKSVLPSEYHFSIDASRLEQFIFSGKVRIEIQIVEKIDEIVLNGVDLQIDRVELIFDASKLLVPKSIVLNEEFEQISLRFDENLDPGKASLVFEFHATIDDQLHGFYRTKDNGQIGACTQFEPSYARRAFPCFDEPCFKARFFIQIRSPSHLTTLSNTAMKSKVDENDGTSIYEFEATPIMSTYLVAFVIGAYDFVEMRDRNNVLIRVYTPLGKKEQGLFALKTAAEILPFYAEYFGIEYPLNKLDMIAISDFGAGAMENWGLITYQETYLLVDSHLTAQETKQEVALIVAHEIAHQWFGNLVTMEWWDDLWLNEGFATWIQFLAVDHVYPSFDVWTQFLCDNLGTCMSPDALHHSHPIETSIRKPGEIDEIFDDITYEKGSSVIRFLHAFIGNEPFRVGLSNYLSEYSYKNTKTEHLWFHLSKSSNRENLSEILSSWTKQMGFPLLTVEEKQIFNDRLLTIEQRRFLADGSIDENVRWKIPVNICSKSNPNEILHSLFIDGEKRREFLLEKIPETDWIKLNLFNVGIYRVFYPMSIVESFVPSILDKTFSPQDRFNIENDLFALAKASIIDFVDYFKFVRHAYKHEDNLTVWKSIVQHFDEFNSILNFSSDKTIKQLFQHYLSDVFTLIYSKLEWEPMPNEGSQASILRTLILTQMGINHYGRAVEQANKYFQLCLQGNFTVNPNIRSPIYLTVAKHGDQNTFQQLKTLYRSAETQEERIRLLIALCYFEQPSIQDQALEFLWDQNEVRKHDHLVAFAALAAQNCRAAEICWNYMKNHWKQIEQLYGEHDCHLIRFVEKVLAFFVSEEKAQEIQDFYQKNENQFLDRPIKKVLERIGIRRRVLQNHEEKLKEFLR